MLLFTSTAAFESKRMVAPSGRFYGPEDFRRRYPDGRIGSDPSLARPEHGEKLIDISAQSIADIYAEFLAED